MARKNGTKDKERIKKANPKAYSFHTCKNKDNLCMRIYLGKTIGYIKHCNEKNGTKERGRIKTNVHYLPCRIRITCLCVFTLVRLLDGLNIVMKRKKK